MRIRGISFSRMPRNVSPVRYAFHSSPMSALHKAFRAVEHGAISDCLRIVDIYIIKGKAQGCDCRTPYREVRVGNRA